MGLPVLFLLAGPGNLPAQESQEDNMPSLEMIVFLGSFEDRDVGWVDPFELLDMDDEQLESLRKKEEADEK